MKEIANNIIDVAFDFYARLLPGASAALMLAFVEKRVLDATLLGVPTLLFVGYIGGHIVQPVASRLADFFELMVSSKSVRDDYLAKELTAETVTRGMQLVNKTWAEMVSFTAFAIFAVGLGIYRWSTDASTPKWPFFVAAAVFCALSFERAHAKHRRMKKVLGLK